MPQTARQLSEGRRFELLEDSDLFRAGIVSVAVEVTPYRRKTPDGDLVLRAYIDENAIEVVFAGRRQTAALPLLQCLIKTASVASAPKEGNTSDPRRKKLLVDGAWRVRLGNKHDVRPQRRFQLVAARWRYRGADGRDAIGGHLPWGGD